MSLSSDPRKVDIPGGRQAPGFPPRPRDRETIRGWDRRASDEYGIPSLILMENAGAGAARIIAGLEESRFPEPFTLLCGPGNNGGDGFVVARHLHNRGLDVRIWVAPGTEFRSGSDAAVNFLIVQKMKIRGAKVGPEGFPRRLDGLLSEGTLVDALFGTGLSRPLEGDFLGVVEKMNSSGRPIVALDIPSGLDADTGSVLGSAIQAKLTITFAAEKTGFHLREGPAHCGQVHVADIGIPREIWAG